MRGDGDHVRAPSSPLQTTLALWREGHRRTPADRAYAVYAALLAAAMTIPVAARGLWAAISAPAAVASLAPAAGAQQAAFAVAACMLGALVVGRIHGPVIMPPFLAHVLGVSPLPRARVYAAPFARMLALCTGWGVLASAIPVTVWSVAGSGSVLGAVAFVACGGAVGAGVAVLWLTAQAASGRTVAVLAVILGVAVVAPVAVPAAWVATPLGWLALAYAAGGASPWAVGVIAVGAGSVAAAPLLLSRLRADAVLAQSVRWEEAVAHTGMLDVGAAAATYGTVPHRGRRLRAVAAPHGVRSPGVRHLVLRSDAVAALRTPGRAVAGVLALAAAGCLLGASAVSAAPWLGVVAAVLAYAGVGPLTDGIRHAVDAASGTALYGIADGHLLAAHVALPLVAAGVVLAGAAALVAATWAAAGAVSAGAVSAGAATALTADVGGPVGVTLAAVHAALSGITIATGVVGCRILSALKGPMPVALLMPVPTPAGDLAAIGRLVWALDGVLLVGAVGAGAVAASSSPWLLTVSLTLTAGIGIHRWLHR